MLPGSIGSNVATMPPFHKGTFYLSPFPYLFLTGFLHYIEWMRFLSQIEYMDPEWDSRLVALCGSHELPALRGRITE